MFIIESISKKSFARFLTLTNPKFQSQLFIRLNQRKTPQQIQQQLINENRLLGVEKVSERFNNDTLQTNHGRIQFHGESLVKEEIQAVAKCITEQAGNIRDFRVNACELDDEDVNVLIEPLLQCSNLTGFAMGWNMWIRDVGALQLSRLIKNNAKLRDFWLGACLLTDIGACGLSDAILQNSSLYNLDLRSNLICDTGGVALAHAIAKHPTLSSLYLFHNLIGDQTVKALMECKNLQSLHISGNNSITDRGIRMVAMAISNHQIRSKHLSLGSKRMTDGSVIALAKAMRENPSALASLSISDCQISHIGCIELAQALEKSTMQLFALNYNENLSDEGGMMDALVLAAKNNSRLEQVDIRGKIKNWSSLSEEKYREIKNITAENEKNHNFLS
jgi:Ran GTPase-activating protein (RanGAP) involved in mRNA processing and transport